MLTTEIWIELAPNSPVDEAIHAGFASGLLVHGQSVRLGRVLPTYRLPPADDAGRSGQAGGVLPVFRPTHDGLRAAAAANRRGRKPIVMVGTVIEYLLAGASGAWRVLVEGPDAVRPIAAAAPGRYPFVIARCRTIPEAVEAVTAGAEGISLPWEVIERELRLGSQTVAPAAASASMPATLERRPKSAGADRTDQHPRAASTLVLGLPALPDFADLSGGPPREGSAAAESRGRGRGE